MAIGIPLWVEIRHSAIHASARPFACFALLTSLSLIRFARFVPLASLCLLRAAYLAFLATYCLLHAASIVRALHCVQSLALKHTHTLLSTLKRIRFVKSIQFLSRKLIFRIFRCVLASLKEGVSVRPSARPSIHHARVEIMKNCRF